MKHRADAERTYATQGARQSAGARHEAASARVPGRCSQSCHWNFAQEQAQALLGS
jgi:uncharacterized protein YPO0396